jgi:hypothetical protein
MIKGINGDWKHEKACSICNTKFIIDKTCSGKHYCSTVCSKESTKRAHKRWRVKKRKRILELKKRYYIKHKSRILKEQAEYKLKRINFLKKRREDNQKLCFDYIGGKKCAICGITTLDGCCYDFHHYKGKRKFRIGTYTSRIMDIDKVKKELDKCKLVCVICHRLITYKRIKPSWVVDNNGT